MVHIYNAIITAALALSAVAPIFAVPLQPRIDSGYSSVNTRALVLPPPTQSPATEPEAAAQERSSPGVGPAVVGGDTPAAALKFNGLSHPISRAIDDAIYLAARFPPAPEEAPEVADSLSRKLAELQTRAGGPSSSGPASESIGVDSSLTMPTRPPPSPPQQVTAALEFDDGPAASVNQAPTFSEWAKSLFSCCTSRKGTQA